jgi:uncharacterized membrane protein
MTEPLRPGGPPDLTLLVRGLLLLAGAGASVGLAVAASRVKGQAVAYAFDNLISRSERWHVVGGILAGAALGGMLGAIVALARRRQGGALLVDRMGRRLAPLLLCGLLPFLLNWRLWAGHELTMLALIAVFGLALQPLARLAIATAPVLDALIPSRFAGILGRARRTDLSVQDAIGRARWLLWALVWTAVAIYTVYFAYFTIQTHYRLGTSALDLAVENNLVWNAAHLGPLFKTSPLGGPDTVHTPFHQTYFSYLLAPLYALSPRPETLLVIQAAMIGLAAVPLFLLARNHHGDGIACVLAAGYLLYPPVHGANLYDFHYQPLSMVFLFAALHLLEQRRDAWAAVMILLAFSVREDVSALVAIIGLYLLLTGSRPRAGLLVTIAGGLVFTVLRFVIMPSLLDGEHAHVSQYKNLLGPDERGFGGVLKTVIGNPFFTLSSLLERDKLIYLLQMLAPLAFLPLRRPIGLLMCVPGFFFTLLATEYPPMIQISFQYTAYWTPFLFIGAIAALDTVREAENAGRLPEGSLYAWVVALAAAMLVSSYQFGAILDKHNARGGFAPSRFGLTEQDHARHDNAYALIAQVPPMATVVASEHIVPHVSSRPDAYTLRTGLFNAEYLLFELSPRDDEQQPITDALGSGAFGVVDVRGEFVLAKRGHSIARNIEILARKKSSTDATDFRGLR